ncbi:DTW domain-containing protein [bacterium]|nr:DTW domain-containing protein [bacterium]
MRAQAAPRHRAPCAQCRNPQQLCYCAQLPRFESDPRFVFLMHPRECKRTIATGRMAHLSLSNSLLLRGLDFSGQERLQTLLADPANHCVVLSPGKNAVALHEASPEAKASLFPPGKQAWVILLDATWSQASRLWRENPALHKLPRVAFVPPAVSRFTVRNQPAAWCYSTIEATHEVLRLLGKEPPPAMLEALAWLVRRQQIYRPQS